jgi:cellulose synthase (UDP-forming)
VQGLAPNDLGAFLLQRSRWARGNLRVFRTSENPITCRGLSGKQRLSYFASLFTYFNGWQRAALLGVLTWTLASGDLPMRASVAVLLALWCPWAVLAFVATSALGRGTLGPLDSTRYGLMTMGIHMRAVLSLFSRRAGAFKVTPKEGVDLGGPAVLRMLPLVTAFGVALAVLCAARVGARFGWVSMPPMPELARVVTLAFGAWELGCIVVLLASLTRRRQLRSHYRFPVSLRARVDGTATILAILDVSPDGVGFASAGALAPGARLRLLTRVPDAWGDVHDLILPVEVRSCRADVSSGTFRIGCRFEPLDDISRQRLLEYCFVVLPARSRGVPSLAAPQDSRERAAS